MTQEKKPVARKRVATPKAKNTLKKEVAVRKEKLEAVKATPPKYAPNELRKGSVLSIMGRRPNKKGRITSRLYKALEDAKDGIITMVDNQDPRFKIQVYAFIHDKRVKFPGLGSYAHKRVGYIVNPN